MITQNINVSDVVSLEQNYFREFVNKLIGYSSQVRKP